MVKELEAFFCHILYNLKGTRFSLYGLGGLPSLLPINSPDIIAHIIGLSYLSDYMVIRAPLGGAFYRETIYISH